MTVERRLEAAADTVQDADAPTLVGFGNHLASEAVPGALPIGRNSPENSMAFMFESHNVIRPTRFAVQSPLCQLDYDDCWSDFQKAELPR